jgi:hypothetical protein
VQSTANPSLRSRSLILRESTGKSLESGSSAGPASLIRVPLAGSGKVGSHHVDVLTGLRGGRCSRRALRLWEVACCDSSWCRTARALNAWLPAEGPGFANPHALAALEVRLCAPVGSTCHRRTRPIRSRRANSASGKLRAAGIMVGVGIMDP